jgi:hypothetical protein
VTYLALLLILLVAPEPRPVVVPPRLAAMTSPPELSGLVWSSTLERFLVVSDDTGLRDVGTYHAPFVLAMSADGKLDETPVPVLGSDALNDAESICAGPDGTFFLITSHSPNREGRAKRARRQLLHLELRGRSLIVRGRADLTELKGGSLLGRAGQPPDAPLDIEAVTFHDGALYVGLKSPLSSAGEALILRVAEPVKQLAAGRVQAASVTRWAAVALCPETACEGVSDLTFLPDGSALVVANSPKGAPKDGGGALWRLSREKKPELLRRFPNLKPEGVTLSPRSTVVLVFDRNQDTPEWVELPLPPATVQ